MDGDCRPPARIHGRGKGQIGQREDRPAVDDPEAVFVMIPEIEAGRGPSLADGQKLDADEGGEGVFADKRSQGFLGDFFGQRVPLLFQGWPTGL